MTFDDGLYQQHFKSKEEILDYLSGKTLKTNRLNVSFTTEDDIDNLAKYFTDEEYLRMFDFETLWPKDIEEAKEYLKNTIFKKDKCFFTIKINATNEYIGQIGFNLSIHDRLWICYWLAEPFQKKGYMSEICLPMIKYFFETCEEFTMLTIRTHVDNISSQKLAKKICDFVNNNAKYRYETYRDTIELFSEEERKNIRFDVIYFKLFKNKS